MNFETESELDARLIHDFMDVVIMKLLRERSFISGYELIKIIHHKFHLSFSPGTVYSIVYSLEREGLLEAALEGKVRLYKLTKRGEDTLDKINASGQRNKAVFASLFSPATSSQTARTSSTPGVSV